MNLRRSFEGDVGAGFKKPMDSPKPPKESPELSEALEEIRKIGEEKRIEEENEKIETIDDADIISEESVAEYEKRQNSKKETSKDVQDALEDLHNLSQEKLQDVHLVEENQIIEEKNITSPKINKHSQNNSKKTFQISNSRAGVGGSTRLKIREVPDKKNIEISKNKQEMPEEEVEKNWFEGETNYSSTSPENDSTKETIAESQNQNISQTNSEEKTSPPSRWQKMKQKIGTVLKTVGLASAIAGGAKYLPEHVEMTKATATETDSWNKLSPFEKFALPVENNLPKKALPSDIDPRYTQVQILKQLAKTSSGEEKKEFLDSATHTEYDLNQATGWADKGKQAMFNTLLQNKKIREKLEKTPGLTMADAFSLLKATALDSSTLSYEQKLDKKLAEYKNLVHTEFIGPETDEVIIFNYASKDAGGLFNGEDIKTMAQTALGKKAQKNPEKFIKLIDTQTTEDTTKENAGDALVQAIEKSKGNTTLYLNTHASSDALAIDLSNSENPQTLKVDGFASAFLNRLINISQTKGIDETQQTLGKIKIIIDGCEGYDFSKNVLSAMKKLYNESNFKDNVTNVPFENLVLPIFVTMAGEKSAVLVIDKKIPNAAPSGSRALTNESYRKLIKQEGGLTGKILFQLQSESYISGGDMTFFVPEAGKLQEVSSYKPTKNKSRGFTYGNKELRYGSSEEDKLS